MPSGKKARGRKNRAKKEANHRRTLWEPTVLRSGVNNASSCEHTLAVLPQIPQDCPAVSLMNHIAGKGFFDRATSFAGVDPVELCFLSLRDHTDVVREESERFLAIDLLLRFVRNVFLRDSVVEGESWFQQRHQNEVMICCIINLLSKLAGGNHRDAVKHLPCRAIKTSNKLVGGNRRDAVKFVAKRLPCTCLKELHRATREKVAKVGTCDGCGNRQIGLVTRKAAAVLRLLVEIAGSRQTPTLAKGTHKEGNGLRKVTDVGQEMGDTVKGAEESEGQTKEETNCRSHSKEDQQNFLLCSRLPFAPTAWQQQGQQVTRRDQCDNAERQEGARAQESRKEGGDSDGGSEDAVGANGPPQRRAGGPPSDLPRRPGRLFHEPHSGQRVLRQGDKFRRRRSIGFVLSVIEGPSESCRGKGPAISCDQLAAAVHSERFCPRLCCGGGDLVPTTPR
ncbi:hypothetical protein THAOC_32510 [Thalassiosira oceanica]|uniref:Uncharacterized protein n=1 Tax=Thalassiosira oceanica TaxID=159749 RepID=K0R5W6_THAOC|nr:hypothetical protein THAOC_32510 [Thalassiosira oceanica]|eukprot:EJK48673.1 hypothetical protein THAOC_32510 [Thalassiosira oceanica]